VDRGRKLSDVGTTPSCATDVTHPRQDIALARDRYALPIRTRQALRSGLAATLWREQQPVPANDRSTHDREAEQRLARHHVDIDSGVILAVLAHLALIRSLPYTRSDLKPARSSSVKISGSSQAAK
jgi:hypothetical protein